MLRFVLSIVIISVIIGVVYYIIVLRPINNFLKIAYATIEIDAKIRKILGEQYSKRYEDCFEAKTAIFTWKEYAIQFANNREALQEMECLASCAIELYDELGWRQKYDYAQEEIKMLIEIRRNIRISKMNMSGI